MIALTDEYEFTEDDLKAEELFKIPKKQRIVHAVFPILLASGIAIVLFYSLQSYIVISYPFIIGIPWSYGIYKHNTKVGRADIGKYNRKYEEPDCVIRRTED